MSKLTFLGIFLTILSGYVLSVAGHAQSPETDKISIEAALIAQKQRFPEMHYRDAYKSFMQDYYGPGHILADTAAASRYLKAELCELDSSGGPLYEPTGSNGNFFRVNISLIRDSIVPYHIFFNAFVESARNITPLPIHLWREKWHAIDSIMRTKEIHYDNETADREMIFQLLKDDKFVVHHSKEFNQSSNFHYRIISREKFQSDILPLLLINK